MVMIWDRTGVTWIMRYVGFKFTHGIHLRCDRGVPHNRKIKKRIAGKLLLTHSIYGRSFVCKGYSVFDWRWERRKDLSTFWTYMRSFGFQQSLEWWSLCPIAGRYVHDSGMHLLPCISRPDKNMKLSNEHLTRRGIGTVPVLLLAYGCSKEIVL